MMHGPINIIFAVFIYRKSAISNIISDRSVRITFLPCFGQINRHTPVPVAITKQVFVAAWHKAAQSHVVPLPSTHRLYCLRSIRSVQLFSFHTSYSSACYRVLILGFTRSPVFCQPSLYCTNYFTKTVETSAHRAILIRVLALYLEGLGFESRTKERVTGIWVRLLLFFFPDRCYTNTFSLSDMCTCLSSINCAVNRPVYCLLVLLVY